MTDLKSSGDSPKGGVGRNCAKNRRNSNSATHFVQTPALIAVKLRKPLPDSYSPDYSPKNQHSAKSNPRYHLLIETTNPHKP